MLDFSKAESEGETHVKFKELRIGETFVLAHETTNQLDLDQQYIYIKSENNRALELNEEDFQYIGESFQESANVVRVKIVVQSVSIVK